jgi:hypothetical protein
VVNVTWLRQGRVSRLDQDRIDDLVELLCDLESARMQGMALDDLGEAVAVLQAAWRAHDIARVVDWVAAIEATGEEMGRGLLQRVAGDVIATCNARDAAAFAATFDRLIRLLQGAISVSAMAPDAVV